MLFGKDIYTFWEGHPSTKKTNNIYGRKYKTKQVYQR